MIYWATESIGSSFLPYYDYANAGALTWMKEGMKNWIGSSKVPAAFALFPKDISQPPREWSERFFNVQRWTEMPAVGISQPWKSRSCWPRTSAPGSRPFARGISIVLRGNRFACAPPMRLSHPERRKIPRSGMAISCGCFRRANASSHFSETTVSASVSIRPPSL
jgi:hypothetical protein